MFFDNCQQLTVKVAEKFGFRRDDILVAFKWFGDLTKYGSYTCDVDFVPFRQGEEVVREDTIGYTERKVHFDGELQDVRVANYGELTTTQKRYWKDWYDVNT